MSPPSATRCMKGATYQPPAGPYLPGPTILLKRAQPVSITVDNQLPEPTSVHWHGIELESYYDGVAGFAGQGRRLAPANRARRDVRGAVHSAAIGNVHLSHAPG